MEKDKLINILNQYFCVDQNCKTYQLINVEDESSTSSKSFEVYRIWGKSQIENLAEYIIQHI